MSDTPTPPEVRHCLDPDSPDFGCVAVATTSFGFVWGVFSPANGGNWESNNDRVSGWAVVSASPSQ